MKNYLSNLNERERWMVIITALCVFFYCYYLLLYAPLNNKLTQKSAQLIEKTETLNWMKTVEKGHTNQSKQAVDNSQLLTILADQLKEYANPKFPYQLQQTGSGDVQLTCDAVPFKLFMSWLAKINSKYTITIKQFEVGKTETAGVTKLMIIMSAETSK